jgi:hypothetical protein
MTLQWCPERRRGYADQTVNHRPHPLVFWVALLTSAVAPAGCAPVGSAVGVPWLRAPESVLIRDAEIGATASIPFEVANVGLADAELVVLAAAPFDAPGGAVWVPAGQSRTVALSVFAADAAPLDAVARLRTEVQELTVRIRVEPNPDRDADGHLAVAAGGDDCDDDRAEIAPGQTDLFNRVDDDCDGQIDELTPEHGEIVVSEILAVGSAERSSPYVEIANLSLRSLDLGGLELWVDGDAVQLASVPIAPGEAAVLCADPDPATNGGIGCDGAAPRPSEARIRLIGATPIDEVDLSGLEFPEGASLELAAEALHPDRNDDPSSWCPATAATAGDRGTPGSATPSCAPADAGG